MLQKATTLQTWQKDPESPEVKLNPIKWELHMTYTYDGDNNVSFP